MTTKQKLIEMQIGQIKSASEDSAYYLMVVRDLVEQTMKELQEVKKMVKQLVKFNSRKGESK